ncbi:unnamed protein product [Trichogramma brassicae]|uniref:Small ribosomal subunit protein bS6m n=1 Tax=Trichogramma brassicae TaxID=86971 RepID=A0A6H5J4L5_9HYME|nr:unnamed protein product [Trichogramma brassicae]
MPTYEMPLLLRTMSRPEVVNTLKRAAESIFDKGGFIRQIDNLGLKPLPYRMSANSRIHHEANHFVLHFDAPPTKIVNIQEERLRDVDVVRCKIYNKIVPEEMQCTFHEENLPPAYRPTVQKMVAIGEKAKAKKEKRKFKFNTGLDYYPFQR